MRRQLAPVELSFDGDLTLPHRFEQRRLGLGRGAVDLVGEQEAGEQRATAEHELVTALVEDERASEIGGEQVGGELGPGEPQSGRVGEAPCGQRLAETGQVLDQHVTAGEHATEHELQRSALADDRAVDLVERLPGETRRRGDIDSGRSSRVGHSASISATSCSASRNVRTGWTSVTSRRSAGDSARIASSSST